MMPINNLGDGMGEGLCYWITGLPGAGKTTLATALLLELRKSGVPAALLDGDGLRGGLCSDLGHSDADRRENIRRASAVARLMADSGLTVVCAFVSPFEADRQLARRQFAPGIFVEIYLNTALEECVRRDPKKLYARAQAGELKGLTGWDAPYEAPASPAFVFDTRSTTVGAMVALLMGQPPMRPAGAGA
ncbi:MAG: adenylyl-sulfate kinase [Pseudomonadota bacterium]